MCQGRGKDSAFASTTMWENPLHTLAQRGKRLLEERSNVLGKRSQQFVLHPVCAAHDLPQGLLKVRPSHGDLLHVDGQLLVALVDLWVASSERVQGGFSCQAFQVSPAVADCLCC